MTDIQTLGRMLNTRDAQYDILEAASSKGTDPVERIGQERMMSRHFEVVDCLGKLIMLTRAQDLTDAAVQLAIVRSEIEPLRSPGPNTDPEKLAVQMECALWSALAVILKAGQIDPEPFAITYRVRLDVDPFPPEGAS